MQKRTLIQMTFLAALLAGTQAHAAELECKMHFTLKSWSLIFKHVSGKGVVSCTNGQTLKVKLDSNGAGLSAGSSKIKDGTGGFTDLHAITDVLGTYAQAGAQTIIKSGNAQVLTKGSVSLALAGVGEGVELGITLGELTISEDK